MPAARFAKCSSTPLLTRALTLLMGTFCTLPYAPFRGALMSLNAHRSFKTARTLPPFWYTLFRMVSTTPASCFSNASPFRLPTTSVAATFLISIMSCSVSFTAPFIGLVSVCSTPIICFAALVADLACDCRLPSAFGSWPVAVSITPAACSTPQPTTSVTTFPASLTIRPIPFFIPSQSPFPDRGCGILLSGF